MLAQKVSAFRGERDISDAVYFFKEIKETDAEPVFLAVAQHKPFAPRTPDELFRERFMIIWQRAHG